MKTKNKNYESREEIAKELESETPENMKKWRFIMLVLFIFSSKHSWIFVVTLMTMSILTLFNFIIGIENLTSIVMLTANYIVSQITAIIVINIVDDGLYEYMDRFCSEYYKRMRKLKEIETNKTQKK